MSKVKVRPTAACICDLFEDILDKHNITIPDEDDAQKEECNCARLYGMTYAELEDHVTSVLMVFAETIKKDDVELIDEY